jgi:hypothetical protein
MKIIIDFQCIKQTLTLKKLEELLIILWLSL